jgi:hypothetical protein
MSVLAPHEVDRFGKILGLLGSNHDGERAAAALKATEFLSMRSMGWSDVGEMLKRPPMVINQHVPPAYDPTPRAHQSDAWRCMESGVIWKTHECQFLIQMAEQRRAPTAKQREWLDGLSDRVTRFEKEASCDY